MKAKMPRQWILVKPGLLTSIQKTQALWRGHFIRRRLKLAGPGVLKRSVCHNDDELVTSDEKKEVHPFNYFSIEQDGKIWWFDQRTMIEWSQKNLEIVNPYTRTPLSTADARRLRFLMLIRKRHGMELTHSEQPVLNLLEVRDLRWMRVVQIIMECGFSDVVHPEHFIGMDYQTIRYFLASMVETTRWWTYEKVGNRDPYTLTSRRLSCLRLLQSFRNAIHTYGTMIHLSRDLGGSLLACLNLLSEPVEFVHFILTALVNSGVLAAGV